MRNSVKADLLKRLVDDASTGEGGAQAPDDEDDVMENDGPQDDVGLMIHAAAQGLADFEVADSSPFMFTPSGSVQPDPLAVRNIEDLSVWYQAAGRLVGCALWNSKTLGVPLARFFCRRVLELVNTERVQAFSIDGSGPAFFGLVGSRVKLESGPFDSPHCPRPVLQTANSHFGFGGFGSRQDRWQYLVVEACSKADQVFVKCQLLQDPGSGIQIPATDGRAQPGWVSVLKTDSKFTEEQACKRAWSSMRRLHARFPFNGIFFPGPGAGKVCGQPVRLTRLNPPPVFCSEREEQDKTLEDVAKETEARDARNARRILEAQDEALAKALEAGLSDEDATRTSEAAVDAMVATIEAEKKRASTATAPSSGYVPVLGESTQQTIMLGSIIGFPCCMESVCFLPSFAMEALGIQDGSKVSMEALPLPLNAAGCPMYTSDAASWHCGRQVKRGKCERGRKSCDDCNAVASPNLTSGLPVAARISWRLPSHDLVGELEFMLGAHLSRFMSQTHLTCISAGMAVSIRWGNTKINICAETVVDGAGKALSEAAVTAQTLHALMPPVEAQTLLTATSTTRSGKDRWRKVAMAVKAAGLMASSTDDALMTGEMMLDYLEQAAADDIDRDQVLIHVLRC